MRFLSLAKFAAALAAIVTFLAACVPQSPGPHPFPPGRPVACTNEFVPVCAQRGQERRTFGNACVARSQGFGVVHQGQCRGGGGGGWGGPQACTMEHRPVCAERRGQRQSFGNACVANAEGFRVVHQGECRRDSRPPQRACTREFAPVCARRGNELRTFGNACMAEAAQFRVVRNRPC